MMRRTVRSREASRRYPALRARLPVDRTAIENYRMRREEPLRLSRLSAKVTDLPRDKENDQAKDDQHQVTAEFLDRGEQWRRC